MHPVFTIMKQLLLVLFLIRKDRSYYWMQREQETFPNIGPRPVLGCVTQSGFNRIGMDIETKLCEIFRGCDRFDFEPAFKECSSLIMYPVEATGIYVEHVIWQL